MRDTSDMMEDALSEDTMMDCGGDEGGGGGGLEDLVDLAADFVDSSSTIQDAAERLLSLLGVDDDNADDFSSSEDEGVEVDVDELENEEDDAARAENTRLLHELAASLAQELKYSQQKQLRSATRIPQARAGANNPFETRNHQIQSMDLTQDSTYYSQNCLQSQIPRKDVATHFRGDNIYKSGIHNQQNLQCFDFTDYSFGHFLHERQDDSSTVPFVASKCMLDQEVSSGLTYLDNRLRKKEEHEASERLVGGSSSVHQDQVPDSWNAGWDACATETLRYLVEDEGLPPHHPTILAMKTHLDLQRERAFAQYVA